MTTSVRDLIRMPKFNRCVKDVLLHFTLMTAAVAAVLVARIVDTSFPVVDEFVVTDLKTTDSGILIEGTMRKVKDCTFNSVSAFTDSGRKVHVQFLDKPGNNPDTSRPVRVQLWGPWEVYSGHSHMVSLYASHRCHIFWDQTTKLVDLPTGVINNASQ